MTEAAVSIVVDVDALYDGEKQDNRVIYIVKWGGREIQRIQNMTRLNGGVLISDAKLGKTLEVIYDSQAQDKANKFQLSKGVKLPYKLIGDQIKVKIPEDEDSPVAGKVMAYTLPNLLDIVYPPTMKETLSKFQIMKVEEAMEKYNKERDKKNKGGGSSREEEEDTRSSRSSRRRSRQRDEEESNPRDDFEEDDGGWDEEEEKPKRSSRKKKSSKKVRRRREPEPKSDEFEDEDDDWGEEEEQPKPPRKKKSSKKKSSKKAAGKASLYDRLSKDKIETASSKLLLKARSCFGNFGGDDTEDCANCKMEDRCVDQMSEGVPDDDE
jgi:hypothetical protein